MKLPSQGPLHAATIAGLDMWTSTLQRVTSESQSPQALEAIEKKSRQFIGAATQDLDFLARKGANPAVLILIIYADIWLRGMPDEWHARRSRDERLIASAKFWSKQKVRMESASRALAELHQNDVYIEWRHFCLGRQVGTNLDKVFRTMEAASECIGKAIQVIDEMELQSGGYEVARSLKHPSFIDTDRRGHRKSGRHQRDVWLTCGATLAHYLKLFCGRPHYSHVCRLLAAAGVDDFADGRPHEVDILRKGINRFEKDEAHVIGVFWRARSFAISFKPRSGSRGSARGRAFELLRSARDSDGKSGD